MGCIMKKRPEGQQSTEAKTVKAARSTRRGQTDNAQPAAQPTFEYDWTRDSRIGSMGAGASGWSGH